MQDAAANGWKQHPFFSGSKNLAPLLLGVPVGYYPPFRLSPSAVKSLFLARQNSTSSAETYSGGRAINCGRPSQTPGLRSPRSITTNASARSRNRALESLKSAHAKSSVIRKRSGFASSSTLFDSAITFSLCASNFLRGAAAALNSPARVRSQNERSAPAPRNRPESVWLGSYSSLNANGWSASASQPHALPWFEQTPWPYCVIFTAVQRNSGRARIRPTAASG